MANMNTHQYASQPAVYIYKDDSDGKSTGYRNNLRVPDHSYH